MELTRDEILVLLGSMSAAAGEVGRGKEIESSLSVHEKMYLKILSKEMNQMEDGAMYSTFFNLYKRIVGELMQRG